MAAEHASLKDGSELLIRPIEPADRQMLVDAFERLSPESRYRRFFSPVSRLSERQLDYLTRIDHHDHEALVAFDEASGQGVGVARFVRTGPGEAEPAMVVADDWQGRGVATALLDRLVERALDEGIGAFKAPVLASNTEAVRVLSRLGDTDVQRRGAELEVSIALREEVPRPEGMRALLRAVAAGAVDPLVTFWHRLLPRGEGDVPGPEAERDNVIVCAVDPDLGPDPPSAAVVQRLAGASGATVALVAARNPLGVDEVEQEQRLRRLCARLRNHGIAADPELRRGDLAAVVLDVAVERRARLIVIDDAGGTEPVGRLLGSTWDHVSHHAPCSVLVARAEPPDAGAPG